MASVGSSVGRSFAALVTGLTLFASGACAGHLTAKPGVFESRSETVTVANRQVTLTVVKPASPNGPPFLVLFASGDGGLRGVSKALLQHLADQGYWVVGFSSPEAFELEKSDRPPNYTAARDSVAAIFAHARRSLGLSDRTPIVVTGMSRGANVVIGAAGDATLKPAIIGAVAIALTREFDYLTIPGEATRQAGVRLDDQGRIQTYPAIERLGSIPLAVIQSTNDSYVPSAESRKLLGPNTETRRLYEVESKNHSFAGGRDALMRDLDDAMRWIAGRAKVTLG